MDDVGLNVIFWWHFLHVNILDLYCHDGEIREAPQESHTTFVPACFGAADGPKHLVVNFSYLKIGLRLADL